MVVRGWSVAGFVLAASACSSWRVQQAPATQVLATPRSEVRLTFVDGSVQTLHATRIVHRAAGDQVVGFRSRSTDSSMSFPVAEIQRVEIQEMQHGTSIGVAIGSFALLFVLVFTASWNDR
jgi:hypothetical protein